MSPNPNEEELKKWKQEDAEYEVEVKQDQLKKYYI